MFNRTPQMRPQVNITPVLDRLESSGSGNNNMEDIKAQGMGIREAMDKAREISTWRLLVEASSSANA